MRSSNFQCTSATDKLHFPLYKIQLFNTFLLQISRSPLRLFSKDKMTTISWKIWLALIFVMIFRILLEQQKNQICSLVKPSLSSQWSLLRTFIRDFFCISFVWLCSQREVSQTKLMQTMSPTKLRTRLPQLTRKTRLYIECTV